MEEINKKIEVQNNKIYPRTLFLKKLRDFNSNKKFINTKISEFFEVPEKYLEQNKHILFNSKIKIRKITPLKSLKQSLKLKTTKSNEYNDKVLSSNNRISTKEKNLELLSKNYERIDNVALKNIFNSYKTAKRKMLKKNLLFPNKSNEIITDNSIQNYDSELCYKNIPKQLSIDLDTQSRRLFKKNNLDYKSRQISQYLSRKIKKSESTLLLNNIHLYRFKQQILDNEISKSCLNSNNDQSYLLRWISSLRIPKNFHGKHISYINLGNNNNPLWSSVLEKYPITKEMSVKAGVNLVNKDYNNFKKNEELNLKFNNKIKNVENLDQISIRGENLYDLEYNREMNSDCRKIIHKSFIDNGKVIMYKDVNNIFGYETIYKNYNGRNKKNNNNRYIISGSQSIKDINSYTFK